MNSSPANTSRRGLYAVYVIAAIVICGSAIRLNLSVPEEISGYVSNGFILPVFRYGLLFVLVACGVVLSSVSNPIELVANLAIIGSSLWFAIQRAEPIVLSYEPLAELIATHPVLTPAMGLTTGGTLLLPLRARRWIVPFVCAICGIALGLFILLESPGTYDSDWFSSAAALGCMATIISSAVLSDRLRRICAESWLRIAGRIFGSWLIAASLMLAALAVLPERRMDSEPLPNVTRDEIDLPWLPNTPRIFDATNLPPAQKRRIGDVVNTPNGETFFWNGKGWEPVN